MTEEEIFDEISARLSAIEFMVRQILSFELRSLNGDPLESALTQQAATATLLREKLEKITAGQEKSRMARLNFHITRIYEDLIAGMEGDKN